jgi:hypothetical protein
MKVGDICKLKDAPPNAIMRAVSQMQYAVPLCFSIVDGKQVIVQVYENDRCVTLRDFPSLDYGPEEEVMIVYFHNGKIEIEDAESY